MKASAAAVDELRAKWLETQKLAGYAAAAAEAVVSAAPEGFPEAPPAAEEGLAVVPGLPKF